MSLHPLLSHRVEGSRLRTRPPAPPSLSGPHPQLLCPLAGLSAGTSFILEPRPSSASPWDFLPPCGKWDLPHDHALAARRWGRHTPGRGLATDGGSAGLTGPARGTSVQGSREKSPEEGTKSGTR